MVETQKPKTQKFAQSKFNILHICDFIVGYDDINQFLDYPGHIVSCSLDVGSQRFIPDELATMFNRPFMGGLDRLGVITRGTEEQVKEASLELLNGASKRFIRASKYRRHLCIPILMNVSHIVVG